MLALALVRGPIVWGLGALALLTPRVVRAEGPWPPFAESRRAVCVGGPGALDAPEAFSVRGQDYQLEGHKLVQLTRDADKVLRIGVVSAIKDARPETLAQVDRAIDWLAAQGLDLLVLNGDLGTSELDLEATFPRIAARGFLTVATIGNTESCGSFNRAAYDVHQQHPSFVNGNWARVLVLDDATVLTLPGYHDRAFVHTGGGAHYKPTDLEVLDQMARAAPKPHVLVAHGPPRQAGKAALDLTYDDGNVGNPAMTELIEGLDIKFGLFGHILEAGGRGTDLKGKARAPRKWHPSLYVNAGTINPDPWAMLDKKTSTGLAIHVELEAGKRARYRVERFRPPPAPAP